MSEEKKIKRVAILTSGGDAPGMNACIRSIVRCALHAGLEPVGVMRGFQGLLAREFVSLNARSVANIIQRGGTVLMASRCEAFLLSEQRAAAFLNMRAAQIDALIAIGGDGTIRGVKALTEEHEFPVCGVPGTIDNDLGGTDFTIGFDTALNTALEMVDRVRDTASAYERVMLVEVMGRESGEIALHVALAGGAEVVLLPEQALSIDDLAEQLKASHERGKSSQIIIVAEGGQAGRSMQIAQDLEGKLSIPIRACVLGHVQRGGSPSARDRILSARLGEAAVNALIEGKTGIMVGEMNQRIAHTPFADCLKEHRPVNQALLHLLGILAK